MLEEVGRRDSKHDERGWTERSEPLLHRRIDLLNQILADSMSLRDLYKKHYWQAPAGTLHQLRLLFDKHYNEQVGLIDDIAERIQLLGGTSIATAADVAEITAIPRPPEGREEAPVQISRLIEAHHMVLKEVHIAAKLAAQAGDEGTRDLLVRQVIKTHQLQVWFLSEREVGLPRPKASGE